MSTKDINVYDCVIWQSSGLKQEININLYKGGSLTISNRNPIEFLGIVYNVRQAALKVYWIACKIDTPDGYSIITRQSIEDKGQRHAMFGTIYEDPTYQPFVEIGLTSINVDVNNPTLTQTCDSYSIWWAPVIENSKKSWSCSIM